MWKQSCVLLTLTVALTTSPAMATDLQGIWAMLPTKSGIANVIEFTEKTATVHPFECYEQGKFDQSSEPESMDYSRSDSSITLSHDGQSVGIIEIKALSADALTLFQAEEGKPNGGTSFVYNKATSVTPRCELYQEPE